MTGPGTNLHVLVVRLLVDSHHKHRSVGRRSGDDDLLCPSLVVSPGLLQGGEHPGGLNNVGGAHGAPGNGGRVSLTEDSDGVAVNNKLPVNCGHLSLVLTVGGVIPEQSRSHNVSGANLEENLLEHVDHVVQVNEGVIDGHNLGSLGHSGPQDKTANTAESVNSNAGHPGQVCKERGGSGLGGIFWA